MKHSGKKAGKAHKAETSHDVTVTGNAITVRGKTAQRCRQAGKALAMPPDKVVENAMQWLLDKAGKPHVIRTIRTKDLIVAFDEDAKRKLTFDNKGYFRVSGQIVSVGGAARWVAHEWPKHTDATWGDDEMLSFFFNEIAHRLEPEGVLVSGIPDNELLEMIAGHERLTLSLPITLPPNTWMDILVGSKKRKEKVEEALSEMIEESDSVNDYFVNAKAES